MTWDFLSKADWLQSSRIYGYLRVIALVNLLVLLVVIGTAHDGVDRYGFLLGTDFLSFWTAGRLLVEHGNVYNIAAHLEMQRSFFAGDYVAFFYPPPFLLFCYPLGFLGYFPALLLWLLLGAALFAVAVRGWLGPRPPGMPAWLLFVAFPPVLITLLHGQSSFLAAGLLGLGARHVTARPWLAGTLLGLAIFKPQLGLLVPVVLLATRQWRPILAAMASAAMLSLAVTILFGPQVWPDWLAVSGKAQQALLDGSIGYAKMQSPFAASMLLGTPTSLALALQGIVALMAAGALAWVGWRRGYSPALAAAMLAAAPLVTPFVLDYDLVLLAFPLAWLAAQTPRPWEKSVIALVFLYCALTRPVAVATGLALMPILLAALFVLLIRHANEPDEREASIRSGNGPAASRP